MQKHLIHVYGEEDEMALSGIFSSLPAPSHPLILLEPRSGRDTFINTDSIPVEWDRHLSSDREEHQQMKNGFLQASGINESSSLKIQQPGKELGTSLLRLQQTETAIGCKTSTRPEIDPRYMGYLRLLRGCRWSIDTVRKVSEKLKEEEEEFSGFTDLNSTVNKSVGVIERWELFQAQAIKKYTQEPELQQQFMSDLTNIWEWLGDTEEELERVRPLEVGTDILAVELQIKQLRKLQKASDARKTIVISINLYSSEFTNADTTDSNELYERLHQLNVKWGRVCGTLNWWSCSLQNALMHCLDFHETSHGLLLWLESIDRKKNQILPIKLNHDPPDTLREHHTLLMQIKHELLESQLKVPSLKDMSCQLLVIAECKDSIDAKERVHVIGNRLTFLLKDVSFHIKSIENILNISNDQQVLPSCSPPRELDTSGLILPVSGKRRYCRLRKLHNKYCVSEPGPSVNNPPSRSKEDVSSICEPELKLAQQKQPFFRRVAAFPTFPLRLLLPLLLLLILVAYLVAKTLEEYTCALPRDFTSSFHLKLRYTNGPPPT